MRSRGACISTAPSPGMTAQSVDQPSVPVPPSLGFAQATAPQISSRSPCPTFRRLNPARLLASGLIARVEHHEELSSRRIGRGNAPARNRLLAAAVSRCRSQTAGRGDRAIHGGPARAVWRSALLFDPAAFDCPPASRARVGAGRRGRQLSMAVAPRLADHCVGLHWPNERLCWRRKPRRRVGEVLPTSAH